MRLPAIFALALMPAFCQTGPPPDPATQAQKQWELGGRTTPDFEKRDGAITDPAILGYLQQLADSMASAAGAQAVKARVTGSANPYAAPQPNRGVYFSRGLLTNANDEAELAGLIAHLLAHLDPRAADHTCVLDPSAPGASAEEQRQREKQATTLAISYLKTAKYDPTGLLSLLNRLAYNHPAWSKAILSEDLLDLRAPLENEPVPPGGYRLNSSAFVQFQSRLAPAAGRKENQEQPVLRPRRIEPLALGIHPFAGVHRPGARAQRDCADPAVIA